MVRFVIHEDILIYKTKIKKLIENCMINIEYKIEEPNSFSDEPTIYIIDLDNKNSMNLIEKIHKNNCNFYIICLTKIMDQIYKLFQHHYIILDVICKYTDYEEKILKDIKYILPMILEKKKVENNLLSLNEVKVPKDELKELIVLEKKLVLKGQNKKRENYTYIINGSFNDLKKQYNCINENHFIYFNEKIFKLQINLQIIKKSHYVKPYNDQLKQKVLVLYHQNMKISAISKLYEIPKRTIYNWIQKEKFLTASKKAEKYDKIVKITKE